MESSQSYQNKSGEDQEYTSFLQNKEVDDSLTQNKSKSWKWAMIAAFIIAVAVIGVAAYSPSSPLASRQSALSFRARAKATSANYATERASLVRYSALSSDSSRSLFESFKSEHGRAYGTTTEEETRYGHFLSFLKQIDERNDAETANGGTAVHAVTKFADRSPEELSAMLGYKKGSSTNQSKTPRKTATLADYAHFNLGDTYATTDWRDILTTPVKDQGYCGSCWAFSGVSQIESDAIRYGYSTTSLLLSEQQVVSCDTIDDVAGCDGGYSESVYDYANLYGLTSATDYPYTSYYDVSGDCSLTTSMTTYLGVESYTAITAETSEETEEAMLAHIVSTGPLSICLNAASWYSYSSGVLSVCANQPQLVDHCVQLVGYESDDDGYWIVRNSWGTTWGQKGFIYIAYGDNLCDITYDPTYATPTDLQ